jgi:hypothetical protein
LSNKNIIHPSFHLEEDDDEIWGLFKVFSFLFIWKKYSYSKY